MTWLLSRIMEVLHWLARLNPKARTAHLRTGSRGETAAYIFLRRLGYRVIATNFRAPKNRGEIDLIAWDAGVLCFIEVKTRVGEGLFPPEASVDAAKKAHLRSVARAYLRRLPGDRNPPCRFDVVSVSYPEAGNKPEIRLLKSAFHWRRQTFRDSATFSRPRPSGSWRPRR